VFEVSRVNDFLRELSFRGIRGAVVVGESLRGTNIWVKHSVLEDDRRLIKQLLEKYGAEENELEGGWVLDGF
jgi:phosphohistidine phosphatase SixA